ncbi:DNA cytosine methyltransferase [Sphingomonas sanguinis]|uniref:DNA cytosine methyltransferase n=1 Tax=Sphingomonas sanguinis TaxID=33051 RepID=UPI0009EAA140|nr:DNA cytosine methyltransferase [Sphingomonas sanguinis]
MRALDLFSAAAGGWTLGLHRAGFVTVAACEIVEWRRILYAENNPHVRLYEDVCGLTAARLVSDLGYLPDIVVGSPPCQDISVANTRGRGVDGERSRLYLEAVRLVGDCRPRWFAFENSAHLRTRGADRLLDALAALGYACEPCVVGAGDLGANHERKRSWLLGFDPDQLAARAADDAAAVGCGPGRPGRRAQPVARPCQPSCGDAADTGEAERRAALEPAGDRERQAIERREGADRHAEPAPARGGHAADADQARPADGRMVAGLRPAQVADNGRGARRGDDRPGAGPLDLCPVGRDAAEGARADWSLADLARHLRLDDGLSAGLADARLALGDGRRPAAASLIVEAFGDAVLPQIPEVIGRAILRTEAALAAAMGRDFHHRGDRP